MAIVRRTSGIVVETSGSVVASSAVRKQAAATTRQLSRPRPGRRRSGATKRTAAGAPVSRVLPAESDIVAAALEDRQLKLVDSIPLAVPPARRRRRPAGGRRRRAGTGTTEGTLVGVADIGVPLAPGERAVVLLEQDGLYSWHLADTEAPAEPEPPAAGGKRKARKRASRKRVAHFRLELAPTPAPPQPKKKPGRRRGGLLRTIIGKAVAYVFRVVLKPVMKAVAKWLEREVQEGLVRITGRDPTAWTRGHVTIPQPDDRPARLLLLVHGTFSSTLGSFGGLTATAAGQTFLDAALSDYDAVIGWDHRTLSVNPADNARQILTWLESQSWTFPPVIDAVTYSRGGLVFRSLVEDLLPQSATFDAVVNRVVFVGCTNGGTELARPANWRRLADTYINVAAAGVRAVALVPGFTAAAMILSEAIRGVGSLVKVLAGVAVDDNAIPGLAAMNPAGPFVKRLNQRQEGQPAADEVYYCAVTSNFDPDMARAEGRTQEIPPGLLIKLFDKATDVMYGKPNDLVVHVEAMTQIDPGHGAFIRERLDYGTNGTVHHCRYFAEPDTADSLRRWLRSVP